MIVWVDVETTGLDPVRDSLLEVGIIVTRDDDDLSEVGRMAVTIRPTARAFVRMGDNVKAMHEDNGLWVEARTIGMELQDADHLLSRWLGHLLGEEKPVMAGSSVHFDRGFLRAHLPTLESLFHYRNIDVSTLKELNRRYRWVEPWEPPAEKAHRALPDLENSIHELRHYLDAIGDAFTNIPIEQA